MTPRATLDRLLACHQAEKDAALAEKRKAQGTISRIEEFARTLSDEPAHLAARKRAEQALALAREGLAKTDERIALADRRIGMTLRALQYLEPAQGGAPPRPRDWRADGEKESREVDDLLARDYGFVAEPVLVNRLASLVNRLQMLSARPDVPVQVRVLATESGMGAAATATTIYFDKAYLDRMPSESELLFVAGHELAHVQLGHFGETIIGREQDAQRLRRDLGPQGEAALGTRAREALIKMRTGPWEQRQEEAADLLGAQQALEAGAAPGGIQEAMLRLDKEERAGATRTAADIQRYRDSLRDHAKPLDRLKTLEAALGEKFWERTGVRFGGACPR
jgi:Zn-dependent protease with chaperone function